MKVKRDSNVLKKLFTKGQVMHAHCHKTLSPCYFLKKYLLVRWNGMNET